MLHVSFLQSMTEAFDASPKLEEQFKAKIQQVMANPTATGGRMKGVANPALQGKIFKVHIGGDSGHRLIYIVYDKKMCVLPVFLSPVPKSRFDYDDVPWEEYCEDILSDLQNNVKSKFKLFTSK